MRARFAPQPQEGFIVILPAVMVGAEEQNVQRCGRVLARRQARPWGSFSAILWCLSPIDAVLLVPFMHSTRTDSPDPSYVGVPDGTDPDPALARSIFRGLRTRFRVHFKFLFRWVPHDFSRRFVGHMRPPEQLAVCSSTPSRAGGPDEAAVDVAAVEPALAERPAAEVEKPRRTRRPAGRRGKQGRASWP